MEEISKGSRNELTKWVVSVLLKVVQFYRELHNPSALFRKEDLKKPACHSDQIKINLRSGGFDFDNSIEIFDESSNLQLAFQAFSRALNDVGYPNVSPERVVEVSECLIEMQDGT